MKLSTRTATSTRCGSVQHLFKMRAARLAAPRAVRPRTRLLHRAQLARAVRIDRMGEHVRYDYLTTPGRNWMLDARAARSALDQRGRLRAVLDGRDGGDRLGPFRAHLLVSLRWRCLVAGALAVIRDASSFKVLLDAV